MGERGEVGGKRGREEERGTRNSCVTFVFQQGECDA